MHANLIKFIFSAVVNTRMCKQILLHFEHGFSSKAKEARHIRILNKVERSHDFTGFILFMLEIKSL